MRLIVVRVALLTALGTCAWSSSASAERDFLPGAIYVDRTGTAVGTASTLPAAKPTKPAVEKISNSLNKSSYVLRIPRILGVFR
jgi:hypothetical protein